MNPRFAVCLTLSLLLPAVTLSGADYAAAGQAFSVTISSESPSIMVGEPAWIVFEIENLSDKTLRFGADDPAKRGVGPSHYYSVRVTGPDGNPLSASAIDLRAIPALPRSSLGAKELVSARAKRTFTEKLFLPQWVTIREPGAYTITVRRTLAVPPPKMDVENPLQPPSPAMEAGRPAMAAPTQPDPGTIEVEASMVLQVEPVERVRMGKLIDRLGSSASRAQSVADPALLALVAIDDERVVPYLRRVYSAGMNGAGQDLAAVALRSLGRYDSDEALKVLSAALHETYGMPTGLGLAPAPGTPNRTIRDAAAEGLAYARSEKGRQLLLAERTNEDVNIRLAVVKLLGRMPASEARPLLLEMIGGTNWTVSSAAVAALQTVEREADRVDTLAFAEKFNDEANIADTIATIDALIDSGEEEVLNSLAEARSRGGVTTKNGLYLSYTVTNTGGRFVVQFSTSRSEFLPASIGNLVTGLFLARSGLPTPAGFSIVPGQVFRATWSYPAEDFARIRESMARFRRETRLESNPAQVMGKAAALAADLMPNSPSVASARSRGGRGGIVPPATGN